MYSHVAFACFNDSRFFAGKMFTKDADFVGLAPAEILEEAAGVQIGRFAEVEDDEDAVLQIGGPTPDDVVTVETSELVVVVVEIPETELDTDWLVRSDVLSVETSELVDVVVKIPEPEVDTD